MSSITIVHNNTVLGISGVFTSDWVRVSGLDTQDSALTTIPILHDRQRLIGECYSDQASAALGVIIQGSNDNGTTVRTLLAFSAVAATVETFDVLIPTKYVRVQYTNGLVAQASFELIARLVGEV